MKSANIKKYVLSILCILIGLAIGLSRPPGELTVESMRYLGIFMTAVLLLILQLYPAPLVALFACIALLPSMCVLSRRHSRPGAGIPCGPLS